MPSSVESSSLGAGRPSLEALLNPWNWIALIFALQSLGALITVHLFELRLSDVGSPLVVLVLGFLTAIALRWYDSAFRLGPWKWWVPALIYALVVFLLSGRSYPDARPLWNPKLFHLAEYMTLGIFLSGAWHSLFQQQNTLGFIVSVQAFGSAYAFADEYHQAFIPGRTSTPMDVLLDSAAVAFGLGLFILARFIHQARGRTGATLLVSSEQP